MGTLSEQSEEKLEESQEIAKDAVIAVETYVSLFRGKGWVYCNWGLEWTCVGILRGLNRSFILGCLLNCNFSFMIINTILMSWFKLVDKIEYSW